ELNYVRRNGERFPAEVDSVVLPGPSARSFVILRDITERKRAEAALVASEQRYRLLFDRNPDGVFAVDTTGRFLVANPACETISGYPMAELLQKTFLELCAPDQLATALEHFQRGVREGGYEQLETALVHQDGRRVEVWVAGEALVSEGQTSALYCTVKDITARKQAEQALARTRAELERHNQELEHRVQERTAKLQKALAEMEHFSYAIVHDMRAPLRALRGFAELAEQQCAGSQQTLALGYFDRIKIASKRMDNLICDSLNYSKTVREQLPSEPVELGNLLRDLVQTYPNLQPEKAEIRLEGAFPLVLGNEAALSQCFGNLLDNAVKFAKPNAPSRIRVWAEPRRSSGLMDEGMAAPEGASHQARKPPIHSSTPLVRIWVEDDGIGIPKNLHRRIFDMFQRGTNHHAGTGIGLAIVSKVVERMGGRVGVESQEGKGSRFWVELPAPT
ncbi:MAG TPA: PAS domain-containing sensor histidine kinase, partial [Bacillota bacterium]|nr:PAS domain-containing sensor histidine kinase [Bacillota bacterium]